MNSRIVLPFLALTIVVRVYAQTPETVIARAYYNFQHQVDSTDRNSVRTESMVLYMGRHSSTYTSHDREIRREKLKEVMSGNLSNARDIPKATNNAFYHYRSEDKWIMTTSLFDNYAYEIQKPVIQWKLSNETKSISGWRCQKSTGEWKGRTYTAWFCPDLPFSFGPWKLHGLPGLILEAYDSKGEVRFAFVSFENYLLADKTTALPPKSIMTTEDKFQRTSEAIFKNPLGYAKNRTKLNFPDELITTGIAKMENVPVKDGRPVLPGENNPLELTK